MPITSFIHEKNLRNLFRFFLVTENLKYLILRKECICYPVTICSSAYPFFDEPNIFRGVL